jgi:hypothetical protein
MQRIYISDMGDDENDGLTSLTPIRSWEQRLKLMTRNDEIVILGDSEKTIVSALERNCWPILRAIYFHGRSLIIALHIQLLIA